MRERPPHRLVTTVHYQYRWCAYSRVGGARRAHLPKAPRPDPPPLLSQLEIEPSDAYQRWHEWSLRSGSLPAEPVQHNLLPGRVIANWLFPLCQTTVLP
jgi:hypothetical protein